MGRSLGTDLLFFEALYTIFPFPTRQHAYRAVVLVAMIYLAAQIYLAQGDSNSVWMEHVAGFTVASHFMFVAYLLLAEGSFEFPNHWRRVRDETTAGDNPGGLDNLPSNFPLTKKLWWMLDIAWGMRMIGWVQEPRSYAPPRPPPSRRTFLQRTFLKFVTNTIIGDLATSAFALNPAFDHRLHDPTDGPETYLAAVPLLHRVPYVLSWATGARARLSARHNAIALLCVGLGNSSPTLWPDIWGSWGDSYTVRGLFGQAWHQQLRPMLMGFGKLVANGLLKFPRGTILSSLTQLYVAFFLSAVLHFSGDFVVEKRIVSRSFKFFLLQAVAITFESLVIYAIKRLFFQRGKVDKSWTVVGRVIGHCWVTLWVCLTLPGWLDELNALGFSSTDRKPITQFLLNKWYQWT